MKVYRQDFQVLSSDVDMSRTLRLSSLFTRLQEAAIAHTIDLGVPRDKTLDQGLLWAVTQYRAVFHRLPEYDEKVTLLSWPGKTMHLYFPRYFRLVDTKGQVLFEAVSLWVLIDSKTRGIVFPESHDIFIKETVTGNELPMPGRIRTEKISAAEPFKVPYSYVDLNGHMNNARYYDLAVDLMPEALRRRKLRELSSEYIGEARLGDTMNVGFAESENSFYLCGEKEKTVFRMKMLFE
ncbi:MAG: hypothetical protein IJ198_04955 [Lachnospiraceae bacterium]|nr:hypothetical protein [Lachnospiraceae bacterium]